MWLFKRRKKNDVLRRRKGKGWKWYPADKSPYKFPERTYEPESFESRVPCPNCGSKIVKRAFDRVQCLKCGKIFG